MKTFLPNYKDGSIVNLMSSIQKSFGKKSRYKDLGITLDSNTVLLFTIDGLGYDYVEKNEKSFLFKHLRGKLTSMFPSSTAPSISTFFTGLAPSEHAITGWYMYSKEIGTTIITFPYITRLGRVSAKIKIDPNKFFNQKTIFDRIESYLVIPEDVVHMDYNTLGKNAKVISYKGMTDFIRKITRILEKDKKRKYIYAYWSEFDIICHLYGKKSKQALEHYKKLDKKISTFAKNTKNVDIIVTADHGHIDTEKGKTILLNNHPKLIETLERPLSGEPRAAYCYVKRGKEKLFEKYVKKHFGKYCYLFKSKDIADKGWFGPNASSKLFERIGDYTLIMKDNYIIKDIIIGEVNRHLVGNHGGLSSEEMFVPLIVIKK